LAIYPMKSPSNPDIRRILILKPDRIYAEALRQMAHKVCPSAAITLETSIERARATLAAEPVDLLLTGIGASLGGDAIDFVSGCAGRHDRARHVLVITTHHELRLLAALRALPIQGAFDSTFEPPERLRLAIQTVVRGEFYWSRSILDRIRADSASGNSHVRMLTPCEQLVLSVIGGGSDNASAARELDMTPGTISSVRRDLHRKLGVQHRGELMRVAAQAGFVQFTASGVVRPGYSLLAAAHHTRKPKRAQLSAA
jgi:DNA-binding NarL/FixJ family response regulator